MSEVDGYEFWRNTLGGARLAVAPMVDASELAWRLLSRRYGAELCYTPMLHAHVFVRDSRYRRENLASCSEDRPLVVQFCSNDPDTFVAACQLAAPHCDAIDLNLGCPQAIARRGHYGAFLQEEWELVRTMIERASSEVDVAITAKIRVFEDVNKTVEYAHMLEKAGASLLTVHGRTREQKGPLTGLASWSHIKAVKDAVKIPVLANGNIQYLADVEKCLLATGADGVMSAEGNLHNPALFTGLHPPVWQVSLEYLHLALEHPCPTSFSRGHIFKLLHHCLSMPDNFDLRYRLSKTSRVEDMIAVVEDLRDRMQPYHSDKKPWQPDPASDQARLPMPPWLCQPYVRISPEEHLKKVQEQRALQIQRQEQERKRKEEEEEEEEEEKSDAGNDKDGSDSNKRPIMEEDASDLSKKKKKKMVRNPKKSFGKQHDHYEKCICRNPKGGKCSHGLCRACCKVKCYTQGLDCPGHRILVKTKREKAAIYYGQQEALKKEQAGKEDEADGTDGDQPSSPYTATEDHHTGDLNSNENTSIDKPDEVAAEGSVGEVPNGFQDEGKDTEDPSKAVT